MSMPPKRAAVLLIASLTEASSRTLQTSASALPPAFSISSAAVWIVPASFGCGVSVFAAIAMLAPSLAARSAIASPMPREAPVMKSVFPASDMVRSGDQRRLRLQDRLGAIDDRALQSACRRQQIFREEARRRNPRRMRRIMIARCYCRVRRECRFREIGGTRDETE